MGPMCGPRVCLTLAIGAAASISFLKIQLNHLKRISHILYHIDAIPKCSRKIFVSNFIHPSFNTHRLQHSHPYYIHFVHMLLLEWLTICSIGHIAGLITGL